MDCKKKIDNPIVVYPIYHLGALGQNNRKKSPNNAPTGENSDLQDMLEKLQQQGIRL